MKALKLTAAIIVLYGMITCGSKGPQKIEGFIADASMNNITVRYNTAGDTYNFMTADADKSEAHGLFIGSPVTVQYTGDPSKGAVAIKITADRTYAEALGVWTMADPLDASKRMGVNILVEWEAESIGMATLDYSKWELSDQEGRIILHGRSEGSGEPIDFTQTGLITQNSDGSYNLSIEGTDVVYTRQ